MAKRRKFSRWRRLPGVYRIGDDKPPDPNLEPQRLSLYLPWSTLDRAEAQATRFVFETVQDYCTDLLARAIDAERVREQIAEVEAKRGTLEGLHEIADDPEYLAELSSDATSPLRGCLRLPRRSTSSRAIPRPSPAAAPLGRSPSGSKGSRPNRRQSRRRRGRPSRGLDARR